MFCEEVHLQVEACDEYMAQYGYGVSTVNRQGNNIRIMHKAKGPIHFQMDLRVQRFMTGEEVTFKIRQDSHSHLMWELGNLMARLTKLTEKEEFFDTQLQEYVDMDLANMVLPDDFYASSTVNYTPYEAENVINEWKQ
jgi:hypothetical protein